MEVPRPVIHLRVPRRLAALVYRLVGRSAVIADGRRVLLDYIVFGTSPNNIDVVEWNVYRYAHNEFGTVLFAHSRRAYGPDQARFLQDLKTLRPRLVNEHASRRLPMVRPVS